MSNGASDVLAEWKHLSDWLSTEHRDFREHIDRADRQRSEARGRFMALGAGIVGIVIPLLARGAVAVSLTNLARAAVCFLAAIAVSAVADVILRWMGKSVRDRFSTYIDVDFRNKAAIAMRYTDPTLPKDEALETLVDTEHAAFKKVVDRRENFRSVEDVVFYALFIIGLWQLGSGLVF